jgi:hypothetical protein
MKLEAINKVTQLLREKAEAQIERDALLEEIANRYGVEELNRRGMELADTHGAPFKFFSNLLDKKLEALGDLQCEIEELICTQPHSIADHAFDVLISLSKCAADVSELHKKEQLEAKK